MFDPKIEIIRFTVYQNIVHGYTIDAEVQLNLENTFCLNIILILNKIIRDRMHASNMNIKQCWNRHSLILDFDISKKMTSNIFVKNLNAVIKSEVSLLIDLIKVKSGDMIMARFDESKIFTVIEELDSEFDSRKNDMKNPRFNVLSSMGISKLYWAHVKKVLC